MIICIFLSGYLLSISSLDKGSAFISFPMFIVLIISIGWITGAFKEVEIPKPIAYRERSLPETVAKDISELFRIGESSIHIFSGRADHRVYSKEAYLGALKDKIQKDVEIKLILEEEIDQHSFEIIDLIKKGKIECHRLTREKSRKHFVVVDGLHVRIEEKHNFELGEREFEPRAYIKYSAMYLGNKAEKRFQELWEKSKPFEKLSILTHSQIYVLGP